MSSGFISESEILEARRRRQEEWDKVRTEDQPEEAPEEPYDTRPLYQRLEEQRIQKEAEYEEAHKLKNMIRGLDDDEVGFLDLVERSKANAAQQISIEEQREMREFRERVSNLAESEELTRLRAQLAPARQTQPASQTQTQKNKLQGVVVRKRKASEMEGDKPEKGSPPPKTNGIVPSSPKNPAQNGTETPQNCVLRCVGVLPGLGHYDTDSTSDTDDSSDHDSVLCALLFFAHGDYQRVVGEANHFSQEAMSCYIEEVTTALNHPTVVNMFIKFPATREERNIIIQRFYNKYQIPGVVGCVDGSHFKIFKPEHAVEHLYYCRKHYHSLNVQMNDKCCAKRDMLGRTHEEKSRKDSDKS